MSERGQYGQAASAQVSTSLGGQSSVPVVVGGTLLAAALYVIARATRDVHKHEAALARWSESRKK